MGISESVWLVLLSGFIGSAVAAVLAALVAVFVVRRTNRAQAIQAGIGRSEAYTQSEKIRKEQRELLLLQLAEQKNESREAIQVEAISNFVVAARDLVGRAPNITLDELRSIEQRLYVSTTTLNLVSDMDDGLFDLLTDWPFVLRSLAICSSANYPVEPGLNKDEMWSMLNGCVSSAASYLPLWWKPDREFRNKIATKLNERRIAARELIGPFMEDPTYFVNGIMYRPC